MLRILKHIITILAGGVALLPMLIAIVFLLHQQHIKKNMEEQMEHQYLQTITIPLQNLHWIEKGKEIKIDDELFDVKEYFIQNNVAVLTGLFDKKEKSLHKELEKMINNQKQNRETGNGIASLIFSFLSHENAFASFNPLRLINTLVFNLSPVPSIVTAHIEPFPLPPNA